MAMKFTMNFADYEKMLRAASRWTFKRMYNEGFHRHTWGGKPGDYFQCLQEMVQMSENPEQFEEAFNESIRRLNQSIDGLINRSDNINSPLNNVNNNVNDIRRNSSVYQSDRRNSSHSSTLSQAFRATSQDELI
jgi:hypothetical protein